MFIQTETTPNPATLKFLPGREVMSAGTVDFPDAEAGARSPLATRLFAIPEVERVFFGADFVTVTKREGDWRHLKPAILGAIMEHFTLGLPLFETEAAEEAEQVYEGEEAEIVAQIKELIETRVRPAVANDGGDIIFKGFDGGSGTVFLHLQGSCAGCPSSTHHAAQRHREHAAPLHPRSLGGRSCLSVRLHWNLLRPRSRIRASKQGAPVSSAVNDDALETLFRKARTHRNWRPGQVTPQMLMAIYDLARWGPTTNNTSPARFVFIVSPDGEGAAEAASHQGQCRADHARAGDRDHRLRPQILREDGQAQRQSHRAGNLDAEDPGRARSSRPSATAAFRAAISSWPRARSGSIAVRCRASTMRASTRNSSPARRSKSNFLCNLGFGDEQGLRPRAGRLDFDEACKIL